MNKLSNKDGLNPCIDEWIDKWKKVDGLVNNLINVLNEWMNEYLRNEWATKLMDGLTHKWMHKQTNEMDEIDEINKMNAFKNVTSVSGLCFCIKPIQQSLPAMKAAVLKICCTVICVMGDKLKCV